LINSLKVAIALTFALLTACSSGPTYYHTLADEQIPKQEKNGIIFLRVAHAFPGLRKNSLTLAALNAEKTKADEVVIDALDDGGESSSSFLAALPPGTYTILNLGYHTQYFAQDIALQKSIGNFTVHAGSFTNLGTIILGKEIIVRSATEAQPPKLWESQFPNLYRRLTNNSSVQWDSANPNTSSWDQLSDRFTPLTQYLIDLGSNQLASLDSMGTVRIRDAQGVWKNISLHNAAHTLGYARSSTGVEFVALEYQQLFLRSPGVSTWTAVAAPEDKGAVTYTRFAKNGLLYLAMAETDGAVKIYSTAANEVHWRLVGNITAPSPVDLVSMLPGNGDKKRNPDVSISGGLGDSLLIQQIGFGTLGRDPQLTRFDFSNDTIHSLSTPFKADFSVKISDYNGVVIAYNAYSSESSPLYISRDNGVNWQAIAYEARKTSTGPLMRLTSAVKFVDKSMGFATFNNTSLMRTDDGGNHWSIVTVPTKPNQTLSSISLVVGGSPNELLIISEGHYKSSLDQGQSWRIER